MEYKFVYEVDIKNSKKYYIWRYKHSGAFLMTVVSLIIFVIVLITKFSNYLLYSSALVSIAIPLYWLINYSRYKDYLEKSYSKLKDRHVYFQLTDDSINYKTDVGFGGFYWAHIEFVEQEYIYWTLEFGNQRISFPEAAINKDIEDFILRKASEYKAKILK